jgi:hypothetical protein
MGAVLLITPMNPFYLRNLIGFLEQQYCLAASSKLVRLLHPSSSFMPIPLLDQSLRLIQIVFRRVIIGIQS